MPPPAGQPAAPPAAAPPGLALGVLGRGAAMAAGARLLQLVLSVAMLAAVGRVLGAEGYGLFVLAMIALAAGDVVVGGGLTDSLVQRAEITRAHEDASFWSTLLAALGLYAAGWMLAGWLGGLFGQPGLAAVLAVLLAALPVAALGAVPFARLQRAMRFATIAGIDSAAAILGAGAGLVLLLAGQGVWALVAGELLRVGLRSGALLALGGYRPGLSGRPGHAAALFRFNAGTLGVRALAMLDRMLPRALIGALMGAQAVGLYAVAWRLYEQMNALLIHPLNVLALPVAARAQADPQALRGLLEQATRLTTAVAFPAYLGMAALAPVLLPLIVGPGWGQAVPLVQIMLLLGLRAAMASFNGGVLRGLGRPELQAATMAIAVLLTLVLVPLAAPFGLVAVTLAVTARRFLTWPINARQVQRLTGFDWRAQGRAALPNLAAAGAMALLVWLLQRGLAGQHPAPLVLAAGALAGLLLYPLLLAVIAPSHMRAVRARLVTGLRARLARRRRPAG